MADESADDVHMASSSTSSSSVLKKLLDEYMTKNEEDDSNSHCITKMCSCIINDSEISLVTVVECLSSSLTDVKVENRLKGSACLAEFMHR